MPVTRRFSCVATVLIAVFCLVRPAVAQSGRASGVVHDQAGKPIRSATIQADNPAAYPPHITSTSDDKGRWGMIGLATGEWRFTIAAPGFVSQNASVPVRVGNPPSLSFVLARDPGPIPGALDKNIQQQISEAGALRDQGRLDQAIAAYQDIRTKNPKLTSINFPLADAYRRKAAAERDPAARRSLLQLAINSYDELLKVDAANERVHSDLDSARAEIAGIPNGTNR
jgi:hypothetical protein